MKNKKIMIKSKIKNKQIKQAKNKLNNFYIYNKNINEINKDYNNYNNNIRKINLIFKKMNN